MPFSWDKIFSSVHLIFLHPPLFVLVFLQEHYHSTEKEGFTGSYRVDFSCCTYSVLLLFFIKYTAEFFAVLL